MLTWLGSGEDTLPGMQTAAFSLCSNVAERERERERETERQRENESKLSGVSFNDDMNPILRVPPSGPHLTLITSQRPHLQIPSHWGVRASTYAFCKDTFSP